MIEVLTAISIGNFIGIVSLYLSFANFRESKRNREQGSLLEQERRLAVIEHSIELLRNDFNNVCILFKERFARLEDKE